MTSRPPAPLGDPVEPARHEPGIGRPVRSPVQGRDHGRHDLTQGDDDRHREDEPEQPRDERADGQGHEDEGRVDPVPLESIRAEEAGQEDGGRAEGRDGDEAGEAAGGAQGDETDQRGRRHRTKQGHEPTGDNDHGERERGRETEDEGHDQASRGRRRRRATAVSRSERPSRRRGTTDAVVDRRALPAGRPLEGPGDRPVGIGHEEEQQEDREQEDREAGMPTTRRRCRPPRTASPSRRSTMSVTSVEPGRRQRAARGGLLEIGEPRVERAQARSPRPARTR
jgi:hypothetical protein